MTRRMHARPRNRTREQVVAGLTAILFLLELVAIVVLVPALAR